MTLVAVFIQLNSCSSDNDTGSYVTPEQENDGISTASASEIGADVGILNKISVRNQNGTYQNVHSVLLAVNNDLIFEEYFPGKPIYEPETDWNKHTIHRLHSVTKSYNSALIGIAIDQYGLSLNDPVKDFFPEIDESNWEGQKSNITVRHLLIMSSGLQWDEWSFSYDDPRNDHYQMYNSDNWVHFVLQQPMATSPGSQFLYNSGLSITLGEIIRRKTGQDAGLFAQNHLFRPMGINNIQWDTSPFGIFQTGGGLSLRSRDMLKFGLLFLNKGNWNGEQIISEEWTIASSRTQGPNRGYSYQWWLAQYLVDGITYNAYLAAGRGGQYIIVIDRLQLVAVFTAGNDNALATTHTREMMLELVIPAVAKVFD